MTASLDKDMSHRDGSRRRNGGREEDVQRLEKGMKVDALYRGGKRSYPGTIMIVNRDGTCDVDYDDCDPDTAIANARLIAASPCVLKALERLLAVCEMTTFSDAYPEECEAARAAIAKAKGGAA